MHRTQVVEAMTEAQFTDQVIDLARMAGWLVHHDRGEMRRHIQGTVGFPDLVLLKPSRLIVAELKVGHNKPTEEQWKWLDYFHAAGLSGDLEVIESYVWRPEDELQIISILTRRASSC